MSISSVISRPIDMIGSIILNAGVADESEVSALKAVSGYANRNGLLGRIATLLHRVWNAFKAVFGQSDWDMAHRAFTSIANRHLNIAADRVLSNPQGYEEQFKSIESIEVRAELIRKMTFIRNHSISWFSPITVNRCLNQFVEKINEINERLKPLGIHAESVFNRFELKLNDNAQKITEDLRNTFVNTIAREILENNEDSIFNKMLTTIQEVENDIILSSSE
jgi:hypothetical protein